MYKQPLIAMLQCRLKIVNGACAPVSVMPFAVIRSNDCRHSREHLDIMVFWLVTTLL